MSNPVRPVPARVTFAPQSLDGIQDTPEDRICAICQDTLQNTPANPVIGHVISEKVNENGEKVKVAHLFDQTCIAGALAQKAACPTCRSPVTNAVEYADPTLVQASREGAAPVPPVFDGVVLIVGDDIPYQRLRPYTFEEQNLVSASIASTQRVVCGLACFAVILVTTLVYLVASNGR